jgi:UDPglucose 6-dehydrogenase
MNVAIVGAGYVGLVTGLCLADRGHRVHCVDVDTDKVAQLTRGVLPLHEAGLPELLERHLSKRFFPSCDLSEAVNAADLTMVAVGTPFENGSISLRYVGEAAAAVGRVLARKSDYHVVVVKSTVVPGTTDRFVRQLLEDASGKRCGVDFGLGMNPEFLREGQAVEDFQAPDRIVLGAVDQRSLDAMARLYQDFAGVSLICTNPNTAEMIKYASNALLATLISFANEIGNLCSAATDVDVVDVLEAVHMDKRMSAVAPDGRRLVPAITSYLRAGCGFGGSCFPKDLRALVHWGEENHRSVSLLTAVLETNERQPSEIVGLLKRHFANLKGVRIAVLGLAFKPGTDDIRESPALPVIRELMAEGARTVAYDPVAMPATRRLFKEGDIGYAPSLAEAIGDADAIVLITAWPEFEDVPRLLETGAMRPVVIDGRRMWDKQRIPRYEGIGLGRGPSGSDLRSEKQEHEMVEPL